MEELIGARLIFGSQRPPSMPPTKLAFIVRCAGAILAHIRNTKYSPFYNFYSQQIPSYTLSMRGRFWASTCFSIQWYLVCEDLYIQACYMKCTEYGENDQDGI